MASNGVIRGTGILDLYRQLNKDIHLSSMSAETGEGSLSRGLHYRFCFEDGGGRRVDLGAMDIETLHLISSLPEYIGRMNYKETTYPEGTAGYEIKKSIERLLELDLIEDDGQGLMASDYADSLLFCAERVQEEIPRRGRLR